MFRKMFSKKRTKVSIIENGILTKINELTEFENFEIMTEERVSVKCVIKYSPCLDVAKVKSISNLIESGIGKHGMDVFIIALFAHNDNDLEIIKHFDNTENILYIGIISSSCDKIN